MDNPDSVVFEYEGETGVFFNKEYIDSILHESKNFLEIRKATFKKQNEGFYQNEEFVLSVIDRGATMIGPYSYMVVFVKSDVDEYLELKGSLSSRIKVNDFKIKIFMSIPIKIDDIIFDISITSCPGGVGNLLTPVNELIPSIHNILEIIGVWYKNYLDDLYKLLLDISKEKRYKKIKIDISNNVNYITIKCGYADYTLTLSNPYSYLSLVNGFVSVRVYKIIHDVELNHNVPRTVIDKNLPLTFGKKYYKHAVEELMGNIVNLV